jgi:comEA protein
MFSKKNTREYSVSYSTSGGFPMQFRSFCIIFVFLITGAFIVPTQAVIAKTATDGTKTEAKKKSGKSAKSTKKDAKKKSNKSTKAATGKININTANAQELAEIPGVGPVTAKSIIAYRKKNGKFKSTKDLLNVKGIGEKTLTKMKSQLKL